MELVLDRAAVELKFELRRVGAGLVALKWMMGSTLAGVLVLVADSFF